MKMDYLLLKTLELICMGLIAFIALYLWRIIGLEDEDVDNFELTRAYTGVILLSFLKHRF